MSDTMHNRLAAVGGYTPPNYDPQNQIHYGVISEGSLDPEVVNDTIYFGSHSKDLNYDGAVDEVKAQIKNFVEHEWGAEKFEPSGADLAALIEDWVSHEASVAMDLLPDLKEAASMDEACELIWRAVENGFNDNYDGEACPMFDDGKYRITKCLITDLFVLASPYFTYAPECSPCVPNAGNLDSASKDVDSSQEKRGLKTYCLGHDYFEKEVAPYPVWEVASGNRVVMQESKVTCELCQGSGRDSAQRISDYRKEPLEEVVKDIERDIIRVTNYDPATHTFDCFRCAGHGHTVEKVSVILND